MDVEELPSTSHQASVLAASGGNNNTTKRIRLEDNSQQDIDISGLKYDPNNQNRFAMFAGLEIENIPSNSQLPKKKPQPEKETAPKREKITFCPPIFLFNVNIKGIADQLEAKTPKVSFKIKRVNKNKSKLYFTDPVAHSAMLQTLRANYVHAYSFTPKEFRQLSLVLSGLYNGIEVDRVKNALDVLAPEVVSNVTKYTTPFSIKNKFDTGLLLVTLNPGKELSDVSHIDKLLNQIISWEKPKKKNKEIQCHRCQRWGHVAKNCGSQYNCVKCDQKHEPGQCQRKQNDPGDPYCVNCKEAGHTANWRGCPTYKNYVEKRKESIRIALEAKEAARNNVRRVVSSSFVSPGKSFSNLFNSHNQQNQKSTIIEDFLKLANFFLEPEELTLEQEISLFLADFQKKSKDEAKIEFLRLLKKVQSTYGP